MMEQTQFANEAAMVGIAGGLLAQSFDDSISEDELFVASRVYWRQRRFGSPEQTALVLATIAFLQRNPRVPIGEARARLSDAVHGRLH